MGPEIAIGASIASTGFGAYSKVAEGQAAQSAANQKAGESEFAAARAERAAEFGRIAADQTDVALREELSTTLANIDAIRAVSGIDPASPTGIAIKDKETMISDRNRRTQVASIKLQAAEDERMARYGRDVASYQRSVGNFALKQGYIGAAAKVAGGIAQGYGGKA